MHWSQEVDGSHVAVDGNMAYVVRHVYIPYPEGAPPGLKLACGWFWVLETYEDDRLLNGPPHHFDKCDDAKRFVDRLAGR